MFEKIKGMFGGATELYEQGQEIWDTLQGAFSSLMSEDISLERIGAVGETLKSAVLQGHDLLNKLPEGEWKSKLAGAMEMIHNLGPEIEGTYTPLKDVITERSDVGTTEWATALHDQLTGEDADPHLVDKVKTIMDMF